jgi:hypothetical protein
MRSRLSICTALCCLLAAAGCSNFRSEPAATPAAVAAPAPSAPTVLAAPALPPPVATPVPAVPEARFAAVDPAEIQGVMVELNTAHALDVCGFPALGQFIRDYAQQRIEACPNSAARKAALRDVVQSAALRQQRLDAEARGRGDAPHCEEADRLRQIKEMIPVAQRYVAAADRPLDCSRVSRAEP